MDRVFNLIKVVFDDNEEYFHILPQLFMQYFYKSTFEQDVPVLQIEGQLMDITKRLSAKTVEGIKTDSCEASKSKQTVFKMKHFDPPKENKVKIFKAEYFNSNAEVYT